MKICSNATQLRNALKKIKPSKIAVAFVGSGWKKYISPANLKEIILSPTFGSNPKAIEEIMNMIGENNVYFLDNLHSKIYLGAESVLLGSSNLSNNGFSTSGLLEAGVVLSGQQNLQKCDAIFNDYKVKAKSHYPTTKSKKEKLEELTKKWKTSHWYGLNTEKESEKPPTIIDYVSNIDRIHIAGIEVNPLVYNEEVINAVVPDTKGQVLDDYFADAIECFEEDSIQSGDWILTWLQRKDGDPYKNGNVSWLHVHHVIPNGVKDTVYTKLLGQANDLLCPPLPFILDKPTKDLIREVLASGEFPELLYLDNGETWRFELADTVVPRFLEHLKKVAKSKLGGKNNKKKSKLR